MKLAIVGGGISGLSLAYYLQDKYEITIFEKENWGGKARSVKVGEFLFEEGVNGFLDNAPDTLKLCEEIGIKVVKANENSKIRYVYDDKLIKLPAKPNEFLSSSILPFFAKIRVAMEFFIPPKCEEESVEEFSNRRFGKTFTRNLMTPMIAGIYASTPAITSINAAFSKIKQMECEYGSLFKAMFKRKKGGAPSGELTSFENGMSEFIEKLKEKTKANFIKKEITSLNELKDFDKVVLSIPTYEAIKLVSGQLKELLEKIEYNPVAIVGLSGEIESVSFGILTIKEKTLGILMDKYIFPNRNGIRVMIGGKRFSEVKNLSEEEIKEIALNDIKKITGAKLKVEWIKVHKNAIPNYSKGHLDLVEKIEKEAKKQGLILHSNAYRGVSFNDCIKNAKKIAKEIFNANVL